MISTSLKNGERVALPGLGVFTVVDARQRQAETPDRRRDQDTCRRGEVLRSSVEHGPQRAEESPQKTAAKKRPPNCQEEIILSTRAFARLPEGLLVEPLCRAIQSINP